MHLFRTPVTVPESEAKISHSSRIMLIGSCFSEHIGERLTMSGFNTDINPSGIVYNPLSINTCIKRLIDHRHYEEEDIFISRNRWSSFDHHSRFSHADKKACLEAINSRLDHSSEFIKTADFLFITFGTSLVYRLKDSGRIVSNCHKMPHSLFDRERLSPDDITAPLTETLLKIKDFNNKIRFVFSVSPVRHLREGVHDNQLSKASLLLATDRLCRELGDSFYFPSYEIFMDELRDYRFYGEDMVHPNNVAVQYVWEKFSKSFFSDETLMIAEKIGRIRKSMEHRPFDINSPEYAEFAAETESKIEEIKTLYGIDIRKIT